MRDFFAAAGAVFLGVSAVLVLFVMVAMVAERIRGE